MKSSRVVLGSWCRCSSLRRGVTAQVTSAVLQGVVTDSQGAVLPGVTVVATNTETGLAREVPSDPAGFYRLTALPPGTYALAAELDGFAPFARTGLVLTVGQTAAVDVKLGPAGLNEAVTVGATRRSSTPRRTRSARP